LYFFANTGPDPIAAMVELRGARGTPTFWDPVDGRIAAVAGWSTSDEGLKLPLDLGEYESMFVVVEPGEAERGPASETAALPKSLVLNGTWQARDGVQKHHRLFATDVQLPRDWPVGPPAQLELRGASQIVRVVVNGKPAGQRFCAPYRFEVGRCLRVGGNRIEVECIGRYSSPVEIANIGRHSFTHDQAATAPCRQTILSGASGR
jgi:hypothetical protein